MRIQVQQLQQGTTGVDVLALHNALRWLQFPIPGAERDASLFGEGTLAAVRAFQKQQGLEALDGVVEAKTIAAINAALSTLLRTARGTIRTPAGTPIAGATIFLFDKNLRSETQLGEKAVSDAQGQFEIPYTFTVGDRDAPNLQVRAVSPQIVLNFRFSSASKIVFEADPQITLDLVDSEHRGTAFQTTLVTELQSLVDGQVKRLADLSEDAQSQDVTFLSGQTGHDPVRVAHMVLADRFAEASKLSPDIFFAFLHHGLPTEASALLGEHPETLRAALATAVREGIISPGPETNEGWKAIKPQLDAWRVQVALAEPADTSQLSLGRIIKSVLPDRPAQEGFVAALVAHDGPADAFWATLAKDPALGAKTAPLKLAVQLAEIGQSHLPLVQAVQAMPEMQSVNDLAKLDQAGWLALIKRNKVGVPAGITGATDADKLDTYAAQITAAVEKAAPMPFFSARLKESAIPASTDLSLFLDSNPGFTLNGERVEDFITANPKSLSGLSDPAGTKAALQRLRRVYRLAPAFQPAAALFEAGQHSAQSISRMGPGMFAAKFGASFGSEDAALQAHARARHVSATAIALVADANPARGRTPMRVLDDVAPDAPAQIPNWHDLFGSTDACACEHCQSVYGPAAYLVDVLHFLRDRGENGEFLTALTARRPDLFDIELSCDNTNTPLPYVDLVLEVLEDTVAPFAPFDLPAAAVADLNAGHVASVGSLFTPPLADNALARVIEADQWWVIDDEEISYSIRAVAGIQHVEARTRQTSGSQKDREANSQFVVRAAYEKLANAIFPWTLPFDLNLEEARVYLEHLGVPLRDVLEMLAGDDRSVALADESVVNEWLGLSEVEAGLIAMPRTGDALLAIYDLKLPTDKFDDIRKIRTFLTRSGTSYRDLLDLLQTRFINADRAVKIVAAADAPADTCDPEKLELHGLTEAHADKIARFVRLWRKLGWSVLDLDRALSAFGGSLDREMLLKLSHVKRLHHSTSIPVKRLLALWSPLDTATYFDHDSASKSPIPSLYDDLFRNPAVIKPADPGFPAGGAFANDTTETVDGHAPAIAAGIGVGVSDVTLLPTPFDRKLSLSNLATLSGHAALARFLRLAIPEYVKALEILSDPLASPSATILFAEKASEAKASGLTFFDLGYLLRNQSLDASKLAFGQPLLKQELLARATVTDPSAERDGAQREIATLFGLDAGLLLKGRLSEAVKALDAANATGLLHRVSRIFKQFQIAVPLQIWLVEHGATNGFYDLTALPAPASYEQWAALASFLSLRPVMQGETGLLELVSIAAPSDAFSDKLAALTGWNRGELAGADVKGLTHRARRQRMLQKLGLASTSLAGLKSPPISNEAARAIKQAARSKYENGDQWSAVAKPLRSALREQQRAALVNLALSTSGQDIADLYGKLLIDPEMSPCMMTTRIKQAISSVQLFVQRCLMNLEEVKPATEDDGWDQWKWMNNYRVWEANRKVFLYPENWIEPELRDDKSPFFKELESKLLEGDLTLDAAEGAFRDYIDKLDHVANLHILATYHQKDANTDIFHVLARTQAPPRVYYHRQRIDSSYWTPWEKLELDIEGDHLIPVIWHDRFYLFWPMFIQKSEEMTVTVPPPGGTLPKPRKYWEVKLAWSERKLGKWAGKKMSSKSGRIELDESLDQLSRAYFAVQANPEGLVIRQDFVANQTSAAFSLERRIEGSTDPLPENPLPPRLPTATLIRANVFALEGCTSDPSVVPLGVGSYDPIPNISRRYMWFEGEGAISLPEFKSLYQVQPALASAIAQFRLIGQDSEQDIAKQPFFYQDSGRTFFVSPDFSFRIYNPPTNTTVFSNSTSSSNQPLARIFTPDVHRFLIFTSWFNQNTTYSFQTFYHPHICALVGTLNREGLDQMLSLKEQINPTAPDPAFDFNTTYGPTSAISKPYPQEGINFDHSGSYSSYNWELFFHAPLMIADRLHKNQRFDEAAKWFHYIFDPTVASTATTWMRYWQTKPFAILDLVQPQSLEKILELLASDPATLNAEDARQRESLTASVKAWATHPFQPHLVARTRTTAYQRTVVMKYIDNLIAWGDHLFRKDTIESINQATQLYILAADILGPKPVELPRRLAPKIQTFRSIESKLRTGDFSDPIVQVEDIIPVGDAPAGMPESPPKLGLLFGVPKNDNLLAYWSRVGDRLFKIRHCMNIEGVVRQLPLFEPPIDPALLVRGAAASVDIDTAIANAEAPLPHYRFSMMSQKATELCGELRSIGSMLLSTLEKRDGEELSLLRSRHETGLLELMEDVRLKQEAEAFGQLEAMRSTRSTLVGRLNHYQRLLSEELSVPAEGDRIQDKDYPPLSKPDDLAGIKIFRHEALEALLLTGATIIDQVSFGTQAASTAMAAIPLVNAQFWGVGVTFPEPSKIPKEASTLMARTASLSRFAADMIGRTGNYIIRELDWVFQHNQAAKEIMQIDRQLVAAEIRHEIAKHELRNHRRQMANARELDDFMTSKFTSQDLYAWMVGQFAGVYFQAYQLALQTAKRAEQCYQNEIGGTGNFIKVGYWDSLKQGLLAGDILYHDIKRMEVEYLENNVREFEMTKHVSLMQLSPGQLHELRMTGTCTFTLPEWLFDMDAPNHTFRRIRNVAISIPCVAGPYASVNCELTLQSSARRPLDGSDNLTEELTSAQPMVTSSAQNDSGLFEANLRDERYLPFEGRGLINSKWALKLPGSSAGVPRQFDYETISDVVIHIRYTSRVSTVARPVLDVAGAIIALNKPLPVEKQFSLARGFSLRHDFPTEWAKFKNSDPANPTPMVIELREVHFPYWLQGKPIQATSLEMSLGHDTPISAAAPNHLAFPVSISLPLTDRAAKDVWVLLKYVIKP